MLRPVSLTLLAALAAGTPVLAADGAAGHQRASPIQASARVEVARLVAAASAAAPVTGLRQAPPRRRHWIQRHPACTAAIVGFVSGFLVGYLPGDDAVFDDFVAEFNGAVVGGIGAGAGAAIVTIIQALRTPPPAGRGKAGAGSGTAAPPPDR